MPGTSHVIETLDPRRLPRQARSRQTCADILTAAADVLRKDGASAFNTNSIAERAGVSVGSLYQYYPTKEAILATLIREMRRAMRADLAEAVVRGEDGDLGLAIRELIEASLGHHLRDPELADALERAEDELPMDAETDALKGDMAALVVAVLERHDVDRADQAARDLIAICHGLVHAAVRAGEGDFADLSRRLNRAAMGYLRT